MVSQTAAISKVDINWLACHLGHDVRVHREFYRPHHFTTELAKVSELLLAVASGNLGQMSVDGIYTSSLFFFDVVKRFAQHTNLAKIAEMVKRRLCEAKVNIVFLICCGIRNESYGNTGTQTTLTTGKNPKLCISD